MSQSVFIYSHYLALGFIALTAYVFGRRILSRFMFSSLSQSIVFCTTLGLGVIAYMVLVLGMIGQFNVTALAVAFLLGWIVSFPVWISVITRTLYRVMRISLQAKIILPVLVLSIIVIQAIGYSELRLTLTSLMGMSLYPPTMFDSTMLHLPEAQGIVDTGSVGVQETLRRPFHANVNQLLFAVMILIGDDVAAQMIPFLMMMLTALALYSWGRNWKSPVAGLWAAGAFLSSSIVIHMGSVAYLDMGLTLFVTMGAYSFWSWTKYRSPGWMALSAAFLTFGAASKIAGTFWLFAVGIIAVFVALVKRMPRSAIAFALVFIITLTPWSVRSEIYTGNTAKALHGSQAADIRAGIDEVLNKATTFVSQAIFYTEESETAELTDVGTGDEEVALEDLKRHEEQVNFSTLLDDWAGQGDTQFEPGIPVSPIYQYLAPLILLLAIRRLRVALLMGVAVTFVYLVGTGEHIDLRYFMPSLAILSILGAVALYSLMAAVLSPLKFRWARGSPANRVGVIAVESTVALIGTLLLISWGITASIGYTQSLGNTVLPTTADQRDFYLSNKRPTYAFYKYLNDTHGSDYRIYGWGEVHMTHYADGVYLGDFNGPGELVVTVRAMRQGGAALLERMNEMDIDYLLFKAGGPYGGVLPKDSEFSKAFKLVAVNGRAELYSVGSVTTEGGSKSAEAELTNGPELLLNPGFEELSASGAPTYWAALGSPTFDSSGDNAREGSTAIRSSSPQNVFTQRVEVEAGTTYLFAAHSRTEDKTEVAQYRLQVKWLGKIKGQVTSQFPMASPRWTLGEAYFVAPEGATGAIVQPVPHLDRPIWFDDLSFKESAAPSLDGLAGPASKVSADTNAVIDLSPRQPSQSFGDRGSP